MHVRFGLPVLLLLLLGCSDGGPATYPVSGIVSYRGEALPTGNVMLVPSQGPAFATSIGADGSYNIQAVAGTHRVVVTALQLGPAVEDEELYDPPPPLLPAKFGNAETSGIVVTVTADGDNQIDLVLE